MSDGKITAAASKPDLSNLPQRSRVGVSRIRTYGAKKYAPGNYLKATLADGAGGRYISGVLRHLQAIQAPGGLITRESLAALDDESGLPHIDHMLCGLEMLREILIQESVLPEDPGVGNEPPFVPVVSVTATVITKRPMSPIYNMIHYSSGAADDGEIAWFTTESAAKNYFQMLERSIGCFVAATRRPDEFWGVKKL